MRRKVIASVAVLVVAAGSLGIAGFGVLGRHRPSTGLGSERAAAPAPIPQKISQSGWAVGTEYVHALDHRLRFHPPASADNVENLAPPPDAGFHFTGTWTTLVVAQSESRIDVQIELKDLKLDPSSAPNAQALPTEDLVQAASRPFFVSYDRHGRAAEVHFPKQTPAMVQGTLRQLVAASQFSLPQEPAARWSALEGNATGEYQAEYRAKGPGVFVRSMEKYVRLVGEHGLEPAGSTAPVIKLGTTEFKLDADGRVESLKQRVVEATPVNDVGLKFDGDFEISFRLVKKGRRADAATLAGNLAGGAFDTAALAADGGMLRRARENAERNLVDGASFADLRTDLGTALRAKDQMALGRAKSRMSAMFRLDPGATLRAVRGLDAETAPAVLDAIGFSGTPEAQKALADVMSDSRADAATRRAAIDSMLTVEHPTREAVGALQKVAESHDPELEESASLMLGVAASRLGKEDPPAAQEIVNNLTKDLGSSNDPKDQERILSSLGNAGSTTSLPSIEAGLKSPDPRVRDTSARALRFIADPKADVLLAGVLTTDQHPLVRNGALFAAGFRAFDPLAQALEFVSKKDQSPDVRLNAVYALTALAKTSGDALVLLDWVAQNDPDQSVREAAKKVVTRPPA